ncbi:MAG: hypothetical protein KatS3mg105_4665 [Gemmatales bacterium]|nr:MAG: hypothetical protein KatS3mg105_4665 [Gemmatales bacterium]
MAVPSGRYRFTGREFESITGFQYHRARYYDPGTGRWISPDPAEADINPYRYAGNSPTNFVDRNGMFLQSIIGTAAEVGSSLATSIARLPFVPSLGVGRLLTGQSTTRDLATLPLDFVFPFGAFGLNDFALSVAESAFQALAEAWEQDPYAVISEIGHTILDIAGLFPVVGNIADLANAVWYGIEGNWEYAALSFAAAIPGLGYLALAGQAGKYGAKGTKLANAFLRATRLSKLSTRQFRIATRSLDVASNVGISGYNVVQGVRNENPLQVALGAFGFTVNAAAVARWSRKTSDALVPAGPLQERFGPFDGLYFNSRAELDAYVRARKGRLLGADVAPGANNGARIWFPGQQTGPTVTPPVIPQAQTTRVFTTTSQPVNLGRVGTGATNAQTGTLTSPGAGGTFVTRTDLTDPVALQRHIFDNVPPGSTPRYVTEIEVPTPGLRVDPTELSPAPTNAWVAPNTSGARIRRVWEIRWVNDPAVGYERPVLVPVTGES